MPFKFGIKSRRRLVEIDRVIQTQVLRNFDFQNH